MNANEIVRKLRGYSQELVAYKLGCEYADNINDAAALIESLQAQLTEKTDLIEATIAGQETLQKALNRRKPENEPLTLDELRKMGGEPVYCVDADGNGAWALVHTQDEVCTDANYGDWEFYCYGWRDNGKMNENGWLAYRHKPERSEG